MRYPLFAFIVLGVGAGATAAQGPRLEGLAVNGTRGEQPLAGAEVILRGGEDGALRIVAKTMTDDRGRFVFANLTPAAGMTFLPGVNHQGIHYPGPRFRLPPGILPPVVALTAYDIAVAPNPLVVEYHEIDVQIQEAALEVTQTLSIRNPSCTTYVGQADDGMSLTTLSLLIPDGFERVTFHDEFNGRHFKLRDKRLVTDIPWTPGKRDVKFTYHLPADDGKRLLEWSADVPCATCRLRVHGKNAERFACNLARLAGSSVIFESSSGTLPAGHVVSLQPASPPTSWTTYLRWLVLPTLAALILITAGARRLRGPASSATSPG